ncbi:hypothetical protein HORIV_50900 [Vreelandella olivaria]|uniref:Uncharacterized protein n=1 Tax=Vreelandella olivaria TaxID=390919 RepID=A0ABM7GPH1_9GAMM|nr:hypothetical protein HORIV_50900 [Halomonas olivaria]
MVGAATAIAGPIAFVGLVVPFVARAFAGPDIRRTLLFCLPIGPLMVISADIISRLVVAPSELPPGRAYCALWRPRLSRRRACTPPPDVISGFMKTASRSSSSMTVSTGKPAAMPFSHVTPAVSAENATVLPPQGYWRLAWQRQRGVNSILFEQRAVAVNLGLFAALLVASVLYLSLGSVKVAPAAVLQALLGSADMMASFVVLELRLPRLAAACSTGAAFALAGILMQTLARNRLATPGIIGIDNGATAFAVASIVGVGVSIAPPVMALAGATTAAVLTFGLAAGSGTQGYRFIVAGIGVGAVFGAVTQLMLARVAIDTANAAYPWTVGSLNARPAGRFNY